MKDKKINRKHLASLEVARKVNQWPLKKHGYSYEDWLEILAACTEEGGDHKAIADYLGVKRNTLWAAVNGWKA